MIRNPSSTSPDSAAASDMESSIATVRDALSGLRYGAVVLTVHDGRVVQIEITEKKRLKMQ